uniref:Limbic system associated membrane protein n=1 Tax=Sphaeramia orbicularis TaxID=375764 RepID=A0A673A4J7_9TELE
MSFPCLKDEQLPLISSVDIGAKITLSLFLFLLLFLSLSLSAAEPLDGEEYLDIIGIMRNQAGRYECKASNDVATPDVKYVNVVVNYPPTIQKTQSSETPVGRLGMLQCDANAVPKPEFEWYRDEKSINIQILGTTTILVFTNVSEEDYGNYTCVATNRLGIQNASVFLYSELTPSCTNYENFSQYFFLSDFIPLLALKQKNNATENFS